MRKSKSKLYIVGSDITDTSKKKKSKSMRSKIVRSFSGIYIFVSIFILLVLLIGVVVFAYEIVDNIRWDFINYFQEETQDLKQLEEYLGEMPSSLDRDINDYWVVSNQDISVALISNNEAYLLGDITNINKNIRQTNRLDFIGNIIRFEDTTQYDYRPFYIDDDLYTMYYEINANAYYNEKFLIQVGALIIALILMQIIGFIIMLVFGSFSTRKYLLPLRDISSLTQQINSDNLNMRLDVSSARYELKDLVLTINKMLDRVQVGYLKQKQFVSDVSHELRTPISVIDGYANMLKRWAKDDKEVFDESIDAIVEETKNMHYMVESLLILARYDNNTFVLDKATYSLSDQIQELHREMSLLDKDMHNIIKSVEPQVFIKADNNKLRQAIREFYMNAIKYTPAKGTISLSLAKDDKNAIITIKDSGIGISRKDIGRVFERFYRADRARTRSVEGYGLGLSIAKAIIIEHKGKISLKSKEGEGTEVVVRIPL